MTFSPPSGKTAPASGGGSKKSGLGQGQAEWRVVLAYWTVRAVGWAWWHSEYETE